MSFNSNINFTSSTPINKDEMKKLQTILQLLMENPDSFEFRVPVDHKKLGLLDYPLIITKPMDLGTVKKKLSQNSYTLVEEFIDDVQMIWHNCKVYNAQGSWIYNLADKLERYYKKLIKTHLPLIPIASKKGDQTQNDQDEPHGLTFSQKNKFSQKMRYLTQEQLGQIVQIIQSSCPLAYKDIEKEKCQILVDNIDQDTFKKLNDKIDNWENNLNEYQVTKKVKLNNKE